MVTAIKEAQRGPTAIRLRNIRLELFRKLNKTRQAGPTPPAEGALDWEEVEKAVIKKLLANDAAHCEQLFSAILAAEADQGKRELNWDFGEGQETLSLTTLRPEAEALITLTDEQNWGGSAHFLRDQPTPALLRQLSAASRLSHFRIAEQVLQEDRKSVV